MDSKKRGSQELLERLTKPTRIEPDQLRHLVTATEALSARILSWEIFGQPGLDRFRATFAIAPEKLPAMVETYLEGSPTLTMKVFPRGIPPFVRELHVQLEQGIGG